jgi:hypothetical protein
LFINIIDFIETTNEANIILEQSVPATIAGVFTIMTDDNPCIQLTYIKSRAFCCCETSTELKV